MSYSKIFIILLKKINKSAEIRRILQLYKTEFKKSCKNSNNDVGEITVRKKGGKSD